MGITEEIEEMEDRLTAQDDGEVEEPEVPAEEETPEVPPVEEEPPVVEEEPPAEEPPTEEPPEELPVEEPPVEEEPAVETPPSEIEDLKNQIRELKALVKPKEVTPPVEEPSDEPLPIDEHNFLGDLDLDELTRDPDQFNKLLNKVFVKGVETARLEVKTGSEGVLRSIPDIVKNNIQVVTAMKKASDEFYTANADLKPFKKVVATVFEELASDNPDKSYKDLLTEVETETRKRLELHKKAVSNNKSDKPPRPPNAKPGKRGPVTKPNTDPFLAELEAMDKSLEF